MVSISLKFQSECMIQLLMLFRNQPSIIYIRPGSCPWYRVLVFLLSKLEKRGSDDLIDFVLVGLLLMAKR